MKIMNKNWSDAKIIEFMEKETGFKNGFVTRDDEDLPISYLSYEDNGFVFAFTFNEDSNKMDYYKLQ